MAGLPRLRQCQQLAVMHAVQQDTETIRRMTPEEKLAVMHVLIRQAWELKAAAIRAREPHLPQSQVRARAWEMVAGGET